MKLFVALSLLFTVAPAFAGESVPGQASPAMTGACREGSTEIFREYDPSNDSVVPVWYICRDGRYVKLYPMQAADVPSPGAHATCREGAKEIFREYDPSNDSIVPVWYVCRGGRYVRLYP